MSETKYSGLVGFIAFCLALLLLAWWGINKDQKEKNEQAWLNWLRESCQLSWSHRGVFQPRNCYLCKVPDGWKGMAEASEDERFVKARVGELDHKSSLTDGVQVCE